MFFNPYNVDKMQLYVERDIIKHCTSSVVNKRPAHFKIYFLTSEMFNIFIIKTMGFISKFRMRQLTHIITIYHLSFLSMH